jgi:hypothetical protein
LASAVLFDRPRGDGAWAAEDQENLQQPLISTSRAVRAPADYDGDGATDIAFKGSNGVWCINLAANGFVTPRNFVCNGEVIPDARAGEWEFAYPGYGDATAVPVPHDYDNDGRADLSVKSGTRAWGIDYTAAAATPTAGRLPMGVLARA